MNRVVFTQPAETIPVAFLMGLPGRLQYPQRFDVCILCGLDTTGYSTNNNIAPQSFPTGSWGVLDRLHWTRGIVFVLYSELRNGEPGTRLHFSHRSLDIWPAVLSRLVNAFITDLNGTHIW
jgi:hypothetical protein